MFLGSMSFASSHTSSFLSGVGNGSLDSAVNVIVLRLWEDGDSGPYMHALHFTWGLGAFLAPLTAKPFLVHQAETGTGNESSYAFTENINGTDATNPFLTIKTLYLAQTTAIMKRSKKKLSRELKKSESKDKSATTQSLAATEEEDNMYQEPARRIKVDYT